MNRRVRRALAAGRTARADYYEWHRHFRIWLGFSRLRAIQRYVKDGLHDPVWSGPAAVRALLQVGT